MSAEGVLGTSVARRPQRFQATGEKMLVGVGALELRSPVRERALALTPEGVSCVCATWEAVCVRTSVYLTHA